MTIDTIKLSDPTNPIEIQEWLDSHVEVTSFKIFTNYNIVYIIY